MMNSNEVTKTLVHERQHELTHNAVVARLARRVRRTRRQVTLNGDSEITTPVELPSHVSTDGGHAIAA